ncbi:hypothetical protein [Streptomyces diastatochromogenes]|uniref:hypothetical protein n=1 Tax=Streptomyces diastatochromogenes TaxID=42236 RepID=UPI00117D3E35|nr:hypothetical protein [Streptomyces diastatochromogenes]MCZ0985013.1 hypothetical protein [Streptomyces diastatochromogenes]
MNIEQDALPTPRHLMHWCCRFSGSGSLSTLLLGPERPADVLDALRHAAEAASDVLLFWYAGCGFTREGGLVFGVMDTDPRHPADTGVALDAVAEIMSTSQAGRPAVILDCDHAAIATTRFTGTAPAPSLMGAETSSFRPMADPFTETLVDGLTDGVQEGPEALDLVTLHNAIEAAYTRTRYYVENEYIGGPSHVLLRGGRELALGINPAFGLPNRSGALPPHPDVVDAQESW